MPIMIGWFHDNDNIIRASVSLIPSMQESLLVKVMFFTDIHISFSIVRFWKVTGSLV